MAGFSVPAFNFIYQGLVAASGTLNVYQTGTTTPVTIYSDGGLTTPISNPLTLDANGQAKFYVSGNVNLRLDAYTQSGTLIESIDPVFTVGGSTTIIGTTVIQGTNLSITSSNTGNNIVSSAAITLTLPLTTTLPTNFYIDFNAQKGAITLSPNASDSIQLGSAGTNYIIPKAASGRLWTDSNGNWGINFYTPVLTTEATLASASTTDLGTSASNIVNITGTTTITSFGSSAGTSNPLYFIRFTGILTLTYNASSLILPGHANITTAAGDTALMKYEGSGNWRCMSYTVAVPGVTAGSYTSANITVNAQGTVTSAANGSSNSPNTTQITNQNPSGQGVSNTPKMLGLGAAGATLTTSSNGTVAELTISGFITYSGAADTDTLIMRYGTGAAPANNAASTGTQMGTTWQIVVPGSPIKTPITLNAIVTGLSTSTAYWFDLSSNSTSTSSLTLVSLNVTIKEIH